MMLRSAICAGVLVAILALHSPAANALSIKECSAKYKAAKEADTLHGMKWNDFRKAQCGAEATANPEPAPTAAPPSSTKADKPAPPVAAPIATGNAVFPSAVSSKYWVNPQARREGKPASISTGLTRPPTQTVGSNGSKKVADITASATNALKGKGKTL